MGPDPLPDLEDLEAALRYAEAQAEEAQAEKAQAALQAALKTFEGLADQQAAEADLQDAYAQAVLQAAEAQADLETAKKQAEL